MHTIVGAEGFGKRLERSPDDRVGHGEERSKHRIRDACHPDSGGDLVAVRCVQQPGELFRLQSLDIPDARRDPRELVESGTPTFAAHRVESRVDRRTGDCVRLDAGVFFGHHEFSREAGPLIPATSQLSIIQPDRAPCADGLF